MMAAVDRYRTQSRWSDPGAFTERLRAIPPDPSRVVDAVSRLLIHPMIAPMRGIFMPEAASGDRNIRSVEAILARLAERGPGDLAADRPPESKAWCVCAGFARVAVAVFRTHGVPARCRAGFAAYFNPGHYEDHWVCELWNGTAWQLLDAQLDEAARREDAIRFAPWDVPRDQFLDGSTAWRRMRAGEIDPTALGLSPLGLVGAWFVAGSVMLDAAALNKEEMLPWEKWSIGRQLTPGTEVPAEWLPRFDAVAGALGGTPDGTVAERVYREHAWLRVTPMVTSFADGAPVEVASGADQ
jgi:hypothetical protein